LRDFPPGDFLVQRLLAELIQTVEAFACGFAGKNAKPRELRDIAPWLDTPAVKRMRERQERKSRAAMALRIARGEG